MVPGFKVRLIQEMKELIDNNPEFQELKQIKEVIKIPDCQFPPNCMAWVGASIVGSLNTEIDRFYTTLDDYTKKNEQLPDRYGEAYLFGTRDEPFFNPEFEYKNQYAKQSLYSSMSPYSARSYQEKKMTINQQLERTLMNMKTPTASQLGSQLGGITPNMTPTHSQLGR